MEKNVAINNEIEALADKESKGDDSYKDFLIGRYNGKYKELKDLKPVLKMVEIKDIEVGDVAYNPHEWRGTVVKVNRVTVVIKEDNGRETSVRWVEGSDMYIKRGNNVFIQNTERLAKSLESMSKLGITV